MNGDATIRIAVFASDGERRAIESSARLLGEALTEAGATPHVVELVPAGSPDDLARDAAIRLASFLPDVARFAMPWAQEEARLRALYTPLCETGGPVLFLTILRHVDISAGDDAHPIRVRIRRLNLLAIELSREFAVCVVDLDRVLADVGARRLRTDYRLGGDALDLAAKTIAMGIAFDMLDAIVPFEVQDRARAIIAARDVQVAAMPAPVMGQNLMTLGKGRRRQTVSAITRTVQADHVGWLVRQLIRRQIGPHEAIAKIGMAVRRRGARDSLALLASGIGRMIGPSR